MAKAKRVEWDEKGSPAENARRLLPGMATQYFARVRKQLAKNPAPPELHRLRLASKHFRYTLELFRPCYAAGLDERIQALKQVQDLLGDTNDAVASLPRIEKAVGGRAERERMRKYLESKAAEHAAAFRKHWEEVFDAAGREEWWTGYLARTARPPVKGK